MNVELVQKPASNEKHEWALCTIHTANKQVKHRDGVLEKRRERVVQDQIELQGFDHVKLALKDILVLERVRGLVFIHAIYRVSTTNTHNPSTIKNLKLSLSQQGHILEV